MKCSQCGKDIEKPNAKFCPHCGKAVNKKVSVTDNKVEKNNNVPADKSSGNDKNGIIIAVTLLIVVVIIALTAVYVVDPGIFGATSSDTYSSNEGNAAASTNTSASSQQASEVQSSQSSGSWKSIGKFEGSGTGTKTISVPAGQIRIDLSAYPIKNYATNHLYLSGSNGKSAQLDWGPRSAVATHSDSISFTSSSETTFSIDYYETVSWQVEVYKYS